MIGLFIHPTLVSKEKYPKTTTQIDIKCLVVTLGLQGMNPKGSDDPLTWV